MCVCHAFYAVLRKFPFGNVRLCTHFIIIIIVLFAFDQPEMKTADVLPLLHLKSRSVLYVVQNTNNHIYSRFLFFFCSRFCSPSLSLFLSFLIGHVRAYVFNLSPSLIRLTVILKIHRLLVCASYERIMITAQNKIDKMCVCAFVILRFIVAMVEWCNDEAKMFICKSLSAH